MQTEPSITLSNLIAILSLVFTLWAVITGWFIAKCNKLEKKTDLKADKEDIKEVLNTCNNVIDKVEARVDEVFIALINSNKGG